MDPDLSHLKWHKSTRSGANNDDCVEVANLPDGGRAVRDSKDPNGPALSFTADEWRTFVNALKSGQAG